MCHCERERVALQSRLQEATSTPILRVSCIPNCVGAKDCQLAAVLDDAADLVHLDAVAELGDDGSVSVVDHSSCADLQWDVVAPETVARDGGGQLIVSLRLPGLRRRHVGRGVPGDGQLDKLHLLGLSVDNDKVRFLSSHCHIWGDGDVYVIYMTTPITNINGY